MIGLGGIGREVARIAKGMGMEVIGWNRTRHADLTVPLVEIDTLLAQSDVVSMNLTLGDETRGFLSAERIARMKPGVDLRQHRARRSRRRSGADRRAQKRPHPPRRTRRVSTHEPLKADHPLAQLPNVTLTSHAGFRTLEASMTLLRRAVDIVKRLV